MRCTSEFIALFVAEIVAEFVPQKVKEVVDHYLGLPAQCGLYTEGYRSTLRALADGLATAVTDKVPVADLLRRVVAHVADSVFNRTERVGELLACARLAVAAGATELGEESFKLAVASSLGPKWYKEDQFSLLVDVVEESHDPRFVAELWLDVAKALELAGGETTFQRFVRYEKQRLIGLLAKSGETTTALSLYLHYVSPSLAVQARRVERLAVDHVDRWRGSRFGVCEIDEQAGILALLGGLQTIRPARLWALVELFWPGDDRHREPFGKLARRAVVEDGGKVVRSRVLRFLRADADQKTRGEYIDALGDASDEPAVASLLAAYSAGFDQPFRAHPIRIPGIRSGVGAKRRVRGWSVGGLGLGLGFQTFLAAHG